MQPHPLSHTSADNGGGGRAERPLEEPRELLGTILIMGCLIPFSILCHEARSEELFAANELVIGETILERSTISEGPTA